MTTVIAVYTSDGCVGRCDARCHEAASSDCDCVCGGRLHGVGAANAVAENTRLLDDAALAAGLDGFASRHGLDPGELRIVLAQQELFG